MDSKGVIKVVNASGATFRNVWLHYRSKNNNIKKSTSTMEFLILIMTPKIFQMKLLKQIVENKIY